VRDFLVCFPQVISHKKVRLRRTKVRLRRTKTLILWPLMYASSVLRYASGVPSYDFLLGFPAKKNKKKKGEQKTNN
jgi:hypothetical protein